MIVREPATEGDMTGRVCAVLPRTGAIRRADASGRSEEQVLAANVDTVVVTVASDTLDLGRMERLLVLAWDSGAQPVVALTKVDIATEAVFEQVAVVAPGASVVEVCAPNRSGLNELREVLHGTVVFVGASGAGKSTLVNALCGRDIQATAPVRQGDGKGRHTTTDREMFPLGGGVTLIDTPGFGVSGCGTRVPASPPPSPRSMSSLSTAASRTVRTRPNRDARFCRCRPRRPRCPASGESSQTAT